MVGKKILRFAQNDSVGAFGMRGLVVYFPFFAMILAVRRGVPNGIFPECFRLAVPRWGTLVLLFL